MTLYAANWANLQQTAADERLLASGYGYIVSPASEYYEAYTGALIRAGDVVTDGQMPFVAAEAPAVDLTVNIMRIEVEANG